MDNITQEAKNNKAVTISETTTIPKLKELHSKVQSSFCLGCQESLEQGCNECSLGIDKFLSILNSTVYERRINMGITVQMLLDLCDYEIEDCYFYLDTMETPYYIDGKVNQQLLRSRVTSFEFSNTSALNIFSTLLF